MWCFHYPKTLQQYKKFCKILTFVFSGLFWKRCPEFAAHFSIDSCCIVGWSSTAHLSSVNKYIPACASAGHAGACGLGAHGVLMIGGPRCLFLLERVHVCSHVSENNYPIECKGGFWRALNECSKPKRFHFAVLAAFTKFIAFWSWNEHWFDSNNERN